MSYSSLSPEVEKELRELAERGGEGHLVQRLEAISQEIKAWEKSKKKDSQQTFQAIQKCMLEHSSRWKPDANPANPVAQAVVAGVLTKEDMSQEAWEAVSFLVTLASL
ncbi:MAG: hypothetical protein MI717_11590 [Spirochaetales bacterium]|nr:hypothetical protein [Spirochaetales bacterium]